MMKNDRTIFLKTTTSFLFILFSTVAFCQEGITFTVEKLSKPEKHLLVQPSKDIYEWLLLSDVKMYLLLRPILRLK